MSWEQGVQMTREQQTEVYWSEAVIALKLEEQCNGDILHKGKDNLCAYGSQWYR